MPFVDRFKLASFVALTLALLVAPAMGQQVQSDPPLVITSVSVVDVSANSATSALRVNQTVVIRAGRIAAVGDSTTTVIPSGAQRINGGGKFLIPGLWDMHAHVLNPQNRDWVLPLYVVNGVTSVRDMHTNLPMKQIGEWRQEIIAGTLIGPRLVAVAGPMIAGPGALFVKDTVATEEEARRAVVARKEMGVDFIKVHDGLSRSTYFAIADESKRQRLTLVGHRGPVTASEALEAGQHSLEHAGFLLAATSSIEAEVISEGMRMTSPAAEVQLLARARQAYSEDRLKALCSRFRSKRASLVPTLVTNYTWDYLKNGSMPSPDWLKYVPQRVTRFWEAPNFILAQLSEKDLAEAQANFDKSIEIVGSMHRAGVSIMAGTDAGVFLRGVIPGISLHSEIALFVKAGFTPLEALRAATLGPARFLKMESTTGSIERGKAADLVLLEANPLEDIRHTEKIVAVIVGGRLHDRRTLDAMLTTLADGARK